MESGSVLYALDRLPLADQAWLALAVLALGIGLLCAGELIYRAILAHRERRRRRDAEWRARFTVTRRVRLKPGVSVRAGQPVFAEQVEDWLD